MSIDREVLCNIDLYSKKSQSLFNAFSIFMIGVLLWASSYIYVNYGGEWLYDFYAILCILFLISIAIHLKILPTSFPYYSKGYMLKEGIEFHHVLIPTQRLYFKDVEEILFHTTSTDEVIDDDTKTIFFILKDGKKASRLLHPKQNDKWVYVEYDFEGLSKYRDKVRAGEIVIVPNVSNYKTIENVLTRLKSI